MTDKQFTYDIAMPDGTVKEWQLRGVKPYLVIETRRTNNLVYNYWHYATPTGASVQMRRLLERQQADAERFANYDINEASFQLASPKEMD